MTTIIDSSTLTSSTASTSSSTSSLTSLTANDFLTLLLTELENQDPTDPMDTAVMVSQFSDLTSVTQQAQTNDYLASLVDSMSAASSSSAVSFLGKTITSSQGGTAAVTSVIYDGGVPYLVTANGNIALSSVTKVTS